MNKVNLCIVGATGLVGRTFLKILEESDIEINNLILVASKKSLGKEIVFKNQKYLIQELNEDVFDGVDYALFFVNSNISSKWCEIASKKVKYVIDNSSFFRMKENCSLVVPEINFLDIFSKSNIIANPNCSTIQCVIPLYALSKKYKIKRIIYNTYQSVSGSGQSGVEEYNRCINGEKNIFYPYNITHTCIPKIGEFLTNSYSEEEMKMINETKKILDDNKLQITSTCVRVPILHGHAVSVIVEFENDYEMSTIKRLLQNQEGIEVCNQYDIPTTIDICNSNMIYIGRLRRDISNNNALMFYCTSDNLRRGASYNAFKILNKIIDL